MSILSFDRSNQILSVCWAIISEYSGVEGFTTPYANLEYPFIESSTLLNVGNYNNQVLYMVFASNLYILEKTNKTFSKIPGSYTKVLGFLDGNIVITENGTIRVRNEFGQVVKTISHVSATANNSSYSYPYVYFHNGGSHVLYNVLTDIYTTYTGRPNSGIVYVNPKGEVVLANSSTVLWKTDNSTITVPAQTTQIINIRDPLAGNIHRFITASSIVSVDMSTYEVTLLNSIFAAYGGFHKNGGIHSTGGIGYYTSSAFPSVTINPAHPLFHALPFVSDAKYKHVVNLDETLTASVFTAKAYSLKGQLVGQATCPIGATSFDLPISIQDPVHVVVTPEYGSLFKVNQAYNIGDKVFPSNPVTFPYYFECTIAGLSGAGEPVWNTATANALTVSGQAIFQLVERLSNSSSKFPIMPVSV